MCSETRSEVVLSKLVVVHAQGEITNLKVVVFFIFMVLFQHSLQ